MIVPAKIDNIFSVSECRRIIDAAPRGTFLDASLVGGAQDHNTRRARTFWLNDDGDEAWVFQRMLTAMAEVNRQHFCFQLEEFSEKLQIACYGASSEGFFDWHVDIGGGALAARRKLTAVVQLSQSSDYEGGDLETNADGHVSQASRQIGSGLFLPSFVLHRVTPVTRGERYSLVLWAHGPAFV